MVVGGHGTPVVAKVDFMFIYANRSNFFSESLKMCIFTSHHVPQIFILFTPERLNGENIISPSALPLVCPNIHLQIRMGLPQKK